VVLVCVVGWVGGQVLNQNCLNPVFKTVNNFHTLTGIKFLSEETQIDKCGVSLSPETCLDSVCPLRSPFDISDKRSSCCSSKTLEDIVLRFQYLHDLFDEALGGLEEAKTDIEALTDNLDDFVSQFGFSSTIDNQIREQTEKVGDVAIDFVSKLEPLMANCLEEVKRYYVGMICLMCSPSYDFYLQFVPSPFDEIQFFFNQHSCDSLQSACQPIQDLGETETKTFRKEYSALIGMYNDEGVDNTTVEEYYAYNLGYFEPICNATDSAFDQSCETLWCQTFPAAFSFPLFFDLLLIGYDIGFGDSGNVSTRDFHSTKLRTSELSQEKLRKRQSVFTQYYFYYDKDNTYDPIQVGDKSVLFDSSDSVSLFPYFFSVVSSPFVWLFESIQ